MVHVHGRKTLRVTRQEGKYLRRRLGGPDKVRRGVKFLVNFWDGTSKSGRIDRERVKLRTS